MGTIDLANPNMSLGKSIKERTKRLYASPIKRIFDENTHEAVGWLYQWNTGETVKVMYFKLGENSQSG